jgi:hypothetical protein
MSVRRKPVPHTQTPGSKGSAKNASIQSLLSLALAYGTLMPLIRHNTPKTGWTLADLRPNIKTTSLSMVYK